MFQESFLVLKYPAARKKEKRLIIIHFEVLTKKIFNGMALHFILYPASSSLIFEIENQGLWNGFNIKNNTEIFLILANNLLYIYQNDKVFYYRGLKGIRILWIFIHWRLPWLINILFAWVYIFCVFVIFLFCRKNDASLWLRDDMHQRPQEFTQKFRRHNFIFKVLSFDSLEISTTAVHWFLSIPLLL